MSAVTSEGGENNQDFDLNLAPIIDCFTVLIAYLMVSASFLSLTVFDVGVAVSGEMPTPTDAPKEPPMSLVLEVLPQHQLTLKLTGGARNIDLKFPIAATADSRIDVESLKAKLNELKGKYTSIEDVSLNADSRVIYRDIVRSIEATKLVFPKVYLSGEKVSGEEPITGRNDENKIQ